MRFFLVLCSLLLVFSACQSSGEDKAAQKAPAEEQAPAPAAKKYQIRAFTPSQPYPDANIGEMNLKDGAWSFGVTGTDYKLGDQTPDAAQKMCANSGKGQHIHLIIDNEPYNARYTAEFNDVEVADGDHYILAFLSRSYHESIKTPQAHVAQQVTVTNQNISDRKAIEGPMLFYSRPKGTYVGAQDTKDVMLDFYLVNATLGKDAYSIKAEINGEEHVITEWQPYYIEGLPMGENTVKLTLLDKEGKVADVPLNPVTRKFTLKADPAE
ncbi:MAG: phosphopeptide-binding protein [Bacteroidota bacterium]